MAITAERDRIVELNPAIDRHRRGNLVHAEPHPRVPVAHEHLTVDERRLDVLRQRFALRLRQLRHDVRDNHVEAGQHGMLARHAVELPSADVAELDAVAHVADVDAGAVETDAHAGTREIELAVVEGRQHHIFHRVPRRHGRNERAHQKPRERGIAVREMIDVGIVLLGIVRRRQAEPVEARIAGVTGLARRHCIASEREEVERAPLEAVGDLLVAAQDLDEVVAVARLL